MSKTIDLINAIQAGDSMSIEQHFDYLMTSRIAEKLDDMRVEVSKNMFKEEAEKIEESEDVTPEEVAEFMQTEEFEQLDEISKESLKSYMDKSIDSYAGHGKELKDKEKAGEDSSKVKKKIMNRLKGQMSAYNKIKKV